MFSWLKTPWKRSSDAPAIRGDQPTTAQIIPRSEHGISRSNISEQALKVLYRLSKAGYEAHLVGGGVRDLLLGREPKDFDIATDASPEQVKRLFRNCRLIGRRFRLAHVHFGREIIEVATFRGLAEESDNNDKSVSESGVVLRDNVYGTLEEDAWRRDFTVNALYYNIKDFSVVDYTGGMADLKAGRMRMIGDPSQRFREDPVRMLRAVRFAAKLGFCIDKQSESAIRELGYLMEEVASARLFDESLKLLLAGTGVASYELLRHYHLFGHLFPETEMALSEEENHFPHTLLLYALESTDARIEEGLPVTPAFLYAAILWEPVRREAKLFSRKRMPALQAIQLAGEAVVSRQVKRVGLPKRFSLQSREIWEWQERLVTGRGGRAFHLLEQKRFRAAYDFLLLREESGEEVVELADWWSDFQDAGEEVRLSMIRAFSKQQGQGKKRRRPRKKQPTQPKD